MTSSDQHYLQLGVCDYPEHVPESEWHKHAQKQLELGLTYVRLSEFSWAQLEPSDGVYDFDWLDRAIACYQQYGLKIILGTPTATPPAWLIEKYPGILPVDDRGVVKQFGSRRHYDHASEQYRNECARIVTKMAQRYGNHEAVIGWQTDNELGHEGTACSYGGASAQRFPAWLKKKYGSLDKLNEAWGTAFWSQVYTAWEQIRPPVNTAVRQPNPSHALDYRRFCSAMIEEFQLEQIDILRRLSPGRFITHNFVIFSAESDLYRLSEALDFVSWDSYPIGMLEFFATWESESTKTKFARTGHPDLVSFNHDVYRGLKNGKGFWIMEQQCGHANWAQYNPLPATGAVALWTAQAWAHGADAVTYFRWRACHMAQEMLHSGLLRHDGSEDRGYADVAAISTSEYPLTEVSTRVALIHDYESLWSYDIQPHHRELSYWRQFMMFYQVFRAYGVDVDIVCPRDAANGNYDFVVVPAMTLISPQSAEYLREIAESAELLFGPRCGTRDETGKVPFDGQLSMVKDIVGARVTNFDSLRPTLTQQVVLDLATDTGSKQHEAALWCEAFECDTATILARYADGPLDGLAAAVSHNNVATVGALSDSLLKALIGHLLTKLNIAHEQMPEGVRKSRRGDKTLVQNFNSQAVTWKGEQLSPVSARTL